MPPAIVHEPAGWSRADDGTCWQEVLWPSDGDASRLAAVRRPVSGMAAISNSRFNSWCDHQGRPHLCISRTQLPFERFAGRDVGARSRNFSETTPNEPTQLPPHFSP